MSFMRSTMLAPFLGFTTRGSNVLSSRLVRQSRHFSTIFLSPAACATRAPYSSCGAKDSNNSRVLSMHASERMTTVAMVASDRAASTAT